MDAKKLITGAVVGTVSQVVLGYLIFDLLFGSFYETGLSAVADIMRASPLIWASVLGNLALAVLVTLAIDRTKSDSLPKGFKVGAIVGFLVWFGLHFNMYSFMEMSTPTLMIVDSLLELVRTGITGALIGLVLSRFSRAEPGLAG